MWFAHASPCCSYVSLFFFALRPPPTSTLFPYTTLFRSHRKAESPGSSRVTSALPSRLTARAQTTHLFYGGYYEPSDTECSDAGGPFILDKPGEQCGGCSRGT